MSTTTFRYGHPATATTRCSATNSSSGRPFRFQFGGATSSVSYSQRAKDATTTPPRPLACPPSWLEMDHDANTPALLDAELPECDNFWDKPQDEPPSWLCIDSDMPEEHAMQEEEEDSIATATTNEGKKPRVSFYPHPQVFTFEEGHEMRREMWYTPQEWYLMRCELQADATQLLARRRLVEDACCDDDGDSSDSCREMNRLEDDDDDDDDDDDVMKTNPIVALYDFDFDEEGEVTFRGLEHALHPRKYRMRRALVLKSVLEEQDEFRQRRNVAHGKRQYRHLSSSLSRNHEETDEAWLAIAQAARVWSRRNEQKAWSLAQADAIFVQMRLSEKDDDDTTTTATTTIGSSSSSEEEEEEEDDLIQLL